MDKHVHNELDNEASGECTVFCESMDKNVSQRCRITSEKRMINRSEYCLRIIKVVFRIASGRVKPQKWKIICKDYNL